VDEFQNFATTSFATILAEARKYRRSGDALKGREKIVPSFGRIFLWVGALGLIGLGVGLAIGAAVIIVPVAAGN